MQKRSHALLAHSLLKSGDGFSARHYEWAFLAGSVQPDLNPFSYLKGSFHNKTFGGHTYGNNQAYIEKRIRRLRDRETWTIWHYYTLGKLTHYIADAFTWPHNPHWPEWGWAHHVYETELRLRLKDYLFTEQPQNRAALWDFPAKLAELHEQYLAEENPGHETDIRYILHANELLMACCQPVLQTEEALSKPLTNAGGFATV